MPQKLSIKNQSVEKIFVIIETMAHSTVPMRLQDIAKAAVIPASTALRFINTLYSLGYIHQDPLTHRYSLTLKFAEIGEQIASQISIRDIARPFLIELSKRSEETCCLGEEHDLEVVYLDVVENPENSLRYIKRPGVRAPMHCTGIGKLLLLNKNPAELDAFIKTKKLEIHTGKTITSYSRLLEELEIVRRQGYAIDDEEHTIGVKCIAAPVKDYSGKILFGISISGPSSRLTPERIEASIPYAIDAANQVSRALGTTEL